MCQSNKTAKYRIVLIEVAQFTSTTSAAVAVAAAAATAVPDVPAPVVVGVKRGTIEDHFGGSEKKKYKVSKESTGAKKYIEYAVIAYRGNEKVFTGKKEYLRRENAESRATVFLEAYTPEVQEFINSKDWAADLEGFMSHASEPSENLLKFNKAGGYILAGQDPETGEVMLYIGSTGCLLVRLETHITEIMKGLSGRAFENKWFYTWCVKHNTIPKCIVAWYEDSNNYDKHFNELAESILITILDTMSDYPDGNCFDHYGHVQNARDGDLPKIAWLRGNASLPAMMPHSTKPFEDREFNLKQCDTCNFKCYQDSTLDAHTYLEHVVRREKSSQGEVEWTAPKVAAVCSENTHFAGFVSDPQGEKPEKLKCQYCQWETTAIMHKRHEDACPKNPSAQAVQRQKNPSAQQKVPSQKVPCQYCSKELANKESLRVHERTCQKNPSAQQKVPSQKVPCQYCSAELANKGSLRVHERTCPKNPSAQAVQRQENPSAQQKVPSQKNYRNLREVQDQRTATHLNISPAHHGDVASTETVYNRNNGLRGSDNLSRRRRPGKSNLNSQNQRHGSRSRHYKVHPDRGRIQMNTSFSHLPQRGPLDMASTLAQQKQKALEATQKNKQRVTAGDEVSNQQVSPTLDRRRSLSRANRTRIPHQNHKPFESSRQARRPCALSTKRCTRNSDPKNYSDHTFKAPGAYDSSFVAESEEAPQFSEEQDETLHTHHNNCAYDREHTGRIEITLLDITKDYELNTNRFFAHTPRIWSNCSSRNSANSLILIPTTPKAESPATLRSGFAPS
ncbi:hypothetical protein KCV07_g2446, partial [Aureobasidium melanogenum]